MQNIYTITKVLTKNFQETLKNIRRACKKFYTLRYEGLNF